MRIAVEARYRGILPCFFRGFVTTLFSSIRRPRLILILVSSGVITSSMYPRSAATYGLANFLRYSSAKCSSVSDGASASAICFRSEEHTSELQLSGHLVLHIMLVK